MLHLPVRLSVALVAVLAALSLAAVSGATTSSATTSSATASSARGPYYYDAYGKPQFQVRPKATIDVSGTGSWLVGKFHWKTWSAAGATATASFLTNSCTPDCAAGHFTGRPAKVRLSAVVRCHGRAVFSKLTVTTPTGKGLLPGGRALVDLRSLGYLSGC